MSVDVTIILQIVRELLFVIFRFLEQAGLNDEEKQKFIAETRAEFYSIVDQPLSPLPPEPEDE